ncbi:cytosine permease [Paraburkholderia saeva]|uniref:cytosine permease n=1 Tax=Paraburkholderia saeva TaxID=2777537 RepID=UPI003981A0BE
MNCFAGTIGGVPGPLYGIMVADYDFVKRQEIRPNDLYSALAGGRYYYAHGWNLAAAGALIPSAIS